MHQQGIRMEGMSDLNALNLESGEVVGGYTLISRLGSGAMGSVWRVRDDGRHHYAMKILRDSLTDESVAGSALRPRPCTTPTSSPMSRRASACGAEAWLEEDQSSGCGAASWIGTRRYVAFIVTELIEGKNLKDDVAAMAGMWATIWNAWPASSSKPPKPYMRPASSIATSNPPM
jgi:serine/threonine protein kinase